MRAVSSLLFRPARLIDSRAAFLLAAVLVLALLACAVLAIAGNGPSPHDPGELIGPFRWLPANIATA